MEYVYFIRNPLADLIKIGASSFLASRLYDLSQATGTDLILEAVVPRGGRTLERYFHDAFAHLHTRGEWFRYAPEIQRLIQEVVDEHGRHQPEEWPRLLTAGERRRVDNPLHMSRVAVSEFQTALDAIDGPIAIEDEAGNLIGVWRPA